MIRNKDQTADRLGGVSALSKSVQSLTCWRVSLIRARDSESSRHRKNAKLRPAVVLEKG